MHADHNGAAVTADGAPSNGHASRPIDDVMRRLTRNVARNETNRPPATGRPPTPARAKLPADAQGLLVERARDRDTLKALFEDLPFRIGFLRQAEDPDRLIKMLRIPLTLLVPEKWAPALRERAIVTELQKAGSLRVVALPEWFDRESLEQWTVRYEREHGKEVHGLALLAIIQKLPAYELPAQGLIPIANKVEPRNDDWLLEQASRPAPPDDLIYHGILGEIVHAFSPNTEADPVAIMVHLLGMWGNLIGGRPHFTIDASRHHLNQYELIIGRSAKARKGTAENIARLVMRMIDPKWELTRVEPGLVSGEGLIECVMDQAGSGPDEERRNVLHDSGPKKKDRTGQRVLFLESEFGRVLTAMKRQGNTLSHVLRQAWDGKRLTLKSKGKPARASNAHVSVIGHITAKELRDELRMTDVYNGLINRFAWFYIERKQLCPHGGKIVVIAEYKRRLQQLLAEARATGSMMFSDDALDLWEASYERLSQEHPEPLGTVLARMEPHVIRYAMIYALTEETRRGTERGKISVDALRAAIALMDFSAACVRFICNEWLGNANAEAILAKLRAEAPKGLSKSEILGMFSRHRRSEEVDSDLAFLIRSGLVEGRRISTEGRPLTLWYATCVSACAKSAKSAKSPPHSTPDTPACPHCGGSDPSCAFCAFCASDFKNAENGPPAV